MTDYSSRYAFVCYPDAVKIYDNELHDFIGEAKDTAEAEKILETLKKQ